MIFYASLPHYFHHLYPIWHQYTPRLPFYVSRELVEYAEKYIDPGWLYVWPLPRGSYPVIVSSYQDYLSTKAKPVIFVEHGAGQSYIGLDSGSYSGGSGRDRTILFLVPNQRVAAVNQQVYPSIRNVVVGNPSLDFLWSKRQHPSANQQSSKHSPPSIVISFHWDCTLLPETRSAFEYYRDTVSSIAISSQFRLIGHAHPKATFLPHYYSKYNIPYVSSWPDAVHDCDMLIVDNSSILYEAAALDIPTITLNAPWYRRTIHHGLRFWDMVPGPQCNNPAKLLDLIHITLKDLDPWPAIRRQIASKVYDPIIGGSKLAVEAIHEVVG